MKAEVILRAEISTVIEVEYGGENDQYETIEEAMDDKRYEFDLQVTQDFEDWMVDGEVWATEYHEDQEEIAREQAWISKATAIVKQLDLTDEQRYTILHAISQQNW